MCQNTAFQKLAQIMPNIRGGWIVIRMGWPLFVVSLRSINARLTISLSVLDSIEPVELDLLGFNAHLNKRREG